MYLFRLTEKKLTPNLRLARALISLRVCAGCSEPLLVAYTTLLGISCQTHIKFLVSNAKFGFIGNTIIVYSKNCGISLVLLLGNACNQCSPEQLRIKNIEKTT